jgi:TPR repeat protein
MGAYEMKTIVIALLLSISCNVFAQSLDDGFAAYDRGDYGEAFNIFLPLAQEGNAEAQTMIGYLYGTGNGVPQNDDAALRWYTSAAEQGYALAQLNLGIMYENVRAGSGGVGLAQRWYRLAAEQGNAEAQFRVGSFSETLAEIAGTTNRIPGSVRIEPDKEYATALRWYTLAAEQSHIEAQYNLAMMYAEGRGIPQNNTEAVNWLRLAAVQGYADAQYRLGLAYGSGQGVPENDIRAYVWFSVSAAQGNENARGNRDGVRDKLTPSQLAQAQELATRCFESDFQDCE